MRPGRFGRVPATLRPAARRSKATCRAQYRVSTGTHGLPARADKKAHIIAGTTSGYGRRTALAKHGSVVLVGRDRTKLDEVNKEIEAMGGEATTLLCDLSDLTSVKRAAAVTWFPRAGNYRELRSYVENSLTPRLILTVVGP